MTFRPLGRGPSWLHVRHPYEVSGALIYIGLGAAAVLREGWIGGAVGAILNAPLATIWGVVFIGSGVALITAASLAAKEYVLALLVEQVALLAVTSFSLILMVAGLAGHPPTLDGAAPIIFACFSLAAGWRLWQVNRILRHLRRLHEARVRMQRGTQ